jgi:NAD(P)-dependent dehydrogenase (short-subunit alcohol dehydrogenase family)
VQYGYRMSKCAAHMLATSLAADLRHEGISVGIVHPGVVITDMTRISGARATVTPEKSVEGILARVEELSIDTTGTFWDFRGEVLQA